MEHRVIQTFLNLDAYNLILSKSIHIYHAESRNVGSLVSTTINRAIPGLIVFLYVKTPTNSVFIYRWNFLEMIQITVKYIYKSYINHYIESKKIHN